MMLFFHFFLFYLFTSSNPVLAKNPDQLPNQLITMEVEQAPLVDFFKSLSSMSNIRFVGLEKIQGNVTLNLKQTPWNDAFEFVLESNQLGYLARNHLIWIAPKREIEASSIFHAQSTLSTPSAQQVLIEARIVEADSKFIQSLGVKLNAQELGIGNNLKNKGTFDTYLRSDNLSGFKPAAAALTLFSKAANPFLTMEISALESDGKGRIVASPRIVTANHVKALIEQGTEVPYFTPSKEGTKVHFKKANLKLEVIPSIKDNHIQLDVEISKDTIGTKTDQGPAIDTKHLRSQILIEDGGTVAIGGVYLELEQDEIVQVPLLGDIPFIGRLFQHKTKVRDKTELLVFLTPTLLPAMN